jgi:hypothetical protein
MLFIEWNIFVQWNSGKWKLGTLFLCVHIDVVIFPILWLRLHELVFIVWLAEEEKKSESKSHDCYLQFLENHIRWRTGTRIQLREFNKNVPPEKDTLMESCTVSAKQRLLAHPELYPLHPSGFSNSCNWFLQRKCSILSLVLCWVETD